MAGVKLLNTQTGKFETVPEGNVYNLTHNWGYQSASPDGTFQQVDPAGNSINVQEKDVEENARRGSTSEDPEITKARKDQREYSEHPIEAGLEGALRTGTLGLSDYVESATGISTPEAIQGREDYNRGASMVGSGLALLAPNPISWVGDIAEAGSEAIGAGKVLSGAMRGGAEMGTMAFGQTNSESALSRDPLTSEAYLSRLGGHLAHDIPLGLLMGGGGSALVEGLGKAADVAGEYGGRIADRVSEKLTPTILKEEAATRAAYEDVLKTTTENNSKLTSQLKAEREALQGAEDAFTENSNLSPHLLKRKTLKGLPPDLQTDIEKTLGLDQQAARQTRIAELDNMLAGTGPEASLATDKAVVSKYESIPGVQKASWEDIRHNAVSNGVKIEDLKSLSPDQVTSLKADLYRSAAQDKLDQFNQAQSTLDSATGRLSGGIAKGVAGVAGHAIGLPGFASAYIGGDILKPLIQKQLKKIIQMGIEHSDGITGATDAFVNGAKKASKAVFRPAKAILRDYIEQDKSHKAPEDTPGLFRSTSQKILRTVVNPQKTKAEIHGSLSHLWATDPRLADQVEAQLFSRQQFLASKLPRNPGVGSMLNGYKDWAPADSEIAKFSRYLNAAHNPQLVLDNLVHGTVSSEEIETLRTLYPATYGQVKQQILNHASELQKNLPFSKQVTLSALFGLPVTSLMKPQAIAMLQSTFAPAAPAPPPQGNGPSSKPAVPTSAQRLSGAE